MVRPIVKDKFLLSQRSAPADRSDLPTAQDMVETIAAHAEECVGMAANMIGVLKRIIVFHEGAQDVTRHAAIEVEFQDLRMNKCRRKYDGITAEIIQHELDHLEGILV